MKKPEPYNDTCPLCGRGNVTLEKSWFDYVTKNDNPTRHEGHHWFYRCDHCEREFTTTDSDGISMEQMKKTKIL